MVSDQQFIEKLQDVGVISDTDTHMILNFMSRWGADSVEALTETHIISEAELADFWAQEFKIERFFEGAILGHVDCLFGDIGYSECKIDKVLPIQIHAQNSPKYLIFCNPTIDKIKKYNKYIEDGFRVGVLEFSVLDRLLDTLYIDSEN